MVGVAAQRDVGGEVDPRAAAALEGEAAAAVGAEGSGSGKIRASRRSRRAARPGLRRGGGAWPRRRGSAPGGEIAEAALGFGWGGGGAARRDWGFGWGVGDTYKAAGRIGVRAWVGRPAISSARIAASVARGRETSPTAGPGLSAAGEHARAPTPWAQVAGSVRG